ncbi:hypothetical protein N5D37_18940 [Comamonas aquatica]|uniref:PilW family protein n=1 Tax=Comamonas aquatica TaxID=225991 RepID=UPI00244C820A|nr:hypothetical protein [Comamonas aquatica]MDH1767666.1 hypothetical protein [Comamonas aquatica]
MTLKVHRYIAVRHPRWAGVTLISLLVGLAISMMVILAALGLFQRMVKTTVDARKDAQSNAQRNASFLSAGLLVQSAGFGIADAVWGTHGMVLEDLEWDAASLKLTGQNSTDGQGNAVVWSDNISGVSQCRLLWSKITPPTQNKADPAGSDLRLFGPEPCVDATEWRSLEWHEVRHVSWTPNTAVTMQQDEATCVPFGVKVPDTQQVRITLIAAKQVDYPNPQPVSTRDSCTGQVTIDHRPVMCTSACLVNLKVPVPATAP